MNKKTRGAVLLPLIGLNLGWFVFMAAAFVGLFEPDGYYSGPMGDVYVPGPEIRVSTYLFLAGIALFSVLASIAHRRADHEYHDSGAKDAGARAAFAFATVAVIVGLVSGAIFAISVFMGSFSNNGGTTTPLGRFLGVYLPILLATVLVVLVLLRATVFRKSSPAATRAAAVGGHMQAAHDAPAASAEPEVKKALALGLSLPIITTAFAMILGLMFWDLQNRELSSWTWVIIQSVIAFGIIAGTRYSMKAIRSVSGSHSGVSGAVGALNLNFVLSIIFGAIVTLMSFVMGFGAIDQLKWRSITTPTAKTIMNNFDANWVFVDFAPTYVLLLLVSVAVFFTLVSRHSSPKAAAADKVDAAA